MEDPNPGLVRAEKSLIELLKAKHPTTLFRPPWCNREFAPEVGLRAVTNGTPFGTYLLRHYHNYLCKHHPAY